MADNSKQSVGESDREAKRRHLAADDRFILRGWEIYGDKYDDEKFMDTQNVWLRGDRQS